ncbi:MAG TPA: nucleotide pyrophosphatase/phosphodiesterase family protein [Jatrophihabitantaceae bacterium]
MITTIADVLPSALAALGVPGDVEPLALPDVRRIGVLLVDGLGYHLLPSAARAAPILADVHAGRLGELREIATCFPSTTPTSLVSLGTGALPGAHGILGFRVNVPGTRRVLTHIDWRADPDPAVWQPIPTQFEMAAAAGLATTVVSRPDFARSGLTIAAYRGAQYVGAADDDALAEAMLAELSGPARLVYGYHAAVDTTAHLAGIDSPPWQEAVAEVGRLLARLVDGLPADAALLVTADHGGVNVATDHRVDADTDRRLRRGVRIVAGEARVRYLHTRRGAREDVIAAWRAVLGDAADVVSRDEAVAAGWFGAVPEQHLARIGDVVVTCRGDYAVLATKHEPDLAGKLVAYHGSMTPAETAIPLVIIR